MSEVVPLKRAFAAPRKLAEAGSQATVLAPVPRSRACGTGARTANERPMNGPETAAIALQRSFSLPTQSSEVAMVFGPFRANGDGTAKDGVNMSLLYTSNVL